MRLVILFFPSLFVIIFITLQVTMGKGAKIRLEEKDNDNLFRECPVETYPGLAIQSVTDSSRYFSPSASRIITLGIS